MIDTSKIVTDLNYMQDPMGRVRFHGIYSGKVVDIKDPLKKGRVRLQIPQVTGTQKSGWVPQVGGVVSQINYPYGTFYTSSDQNIGTSATVITGWNKSTSNKITLANNKFTITEEGDYLINLSAVVKKDTLGFSNVSLWIRKNGTNIANSASSLTSLGLHSAHTIPTAYTHVAPSGGGTVTNNHTDMVINHSGTSPNQVIKHSFTIRLVPKDYLEFVCSADVSGAYLNYSAAGTGPAAPGALATINLIGNFIPKVGTNVWVMFEGGDPEFPVWLGAKA